ncbi:hypothetical protein LKL35_10785 [Streptomyces sp. ET3-23]|uniref:hypothetical protein n=1 Tax=Streptomyces sp. ET3-23 TaxID=2885643 RepID=UPI001D10D3F1|nr:hypothetical protein [Streptomyces sp. ET3-23]MCC2275899.1 hypothetical protein [Streptomyces sp. ET3-23]
MMIDSRLKAVHDEQLPTDAEQQALTEQFTASLGPRGANDMLDGACTLIYMFMQWLRMAYEDHGKDVIEYVVPNLVASTRMMPRSVRPEAIPTMAGLAEHINRLTDDRDFVTRMIVEALSGADED